MPKIPTIKIGSTQLARPRLTTTTPSSEERATGIGKGLESIGNAIQTTGEEAYRKLDEARNYTETAQGELFMAEGLQKIQLREANATEIGPDGKTLRRKLNTPENLLKIKEEIAKLVETAKGFHTSKDGEMRAGLAYSKAAIAGEIAVSNIYTKNMIQEGQMSIEINADRLKKDIVNGVPGAKEELKTLYREGNLLGFLDADVAYNKTQTALEQADYSTYLRDRAINSEEADKKLQSGGYPDLKEDARSRAIANIGNLKAQDRYQQELNAYAYGDKIDMGDPTMTPEFIDSLVNKSATGITPRDADRLKNQIYTKRTSTVKNLAKDPNISAGDKRRGKDYYTTVLQLSNMKEQYDQFGLLLDAYNDKKLSDTEKIELNKVIMNKMSPGLQFKTYVKNVASQLSLMGLPPYEKAIGMATFISKWASGMNPKQAQVETVKETIDNSIPGASLAKDTPNSVSNFNGVTRAFAGDTTLQADVKPTIPTVPTKVGDIKKLKDGSTVKVTELLPDGRWKYAPAN